MTDEVHIHIAGVPDMNVLAAILDDVPERVRDTLHFDGEGLASYIVGKWPEYARLTDSSPAVGLDPERLAGVLARHRRWTGEYEALAPDGEHLANPSEFAAIIAVEYARLTDSVASDDATAEGSDSHRHNEGSCALCTGQHDAEEAAFMNRRSDSSDG